MLKYRTGGAGDGATAASSSGGTGRSGYSASGVRLFTADELASSKGSSSLLRLSILGSVFDVSKGRKHYGEGGGYAFFAGRDGSRAFVTGTSLGWVVCVCVCVWMCVWLCGCVCLCACVCVCVCGWVGVTLRVFELLCETAIVCDSV